MLFDAIVTRKNDQEVMRPAFTRRLRYLRTRSQQWAEPAPGQPADAWERAATRATLHLEVAEADAVLGEIDSARFEIETAAWLFCDWRIPYGVALQRSDYGSLVSRGNDVLSDWRARVRNGPTQLSRGAIPRLT